MTLSIIPVSFRQAKEYVSEHHRHNRPPQGMKFAIGAAKEDVLVGVAVAGRPSSRVLDNGLTLEVTRTCTTGEKNVNSMLYGAVWRAAKAMGYTKLITYTRQDESGASLRAAGFVVDAELRARKGWADSSVTLKHLRHPEGDGGVARIRWRIPA